MAAEEATTESRLHGPWWWSEHRQLSEEQRREILSQLYFERTDRWPFLRRLAALLALSVLIAVFGLALDSGPVVIGAMLISPLTTPLMGLSVALVMGWTKRQLESLLLLVALSAGGVALAFAGIWAIPEPKVVTIASEELLARTAPTLLDLGVAVVAGAAGGYCLARKDAVSALPGVAIAVALVPPLSVVGMTLELGQPALALDALLLYLTNLAGIVLSASIVLLLSGVMPLPEEGRMPRRVRNGLALAGVVVVVISVPLAAFTKRIVTEATDRDDVERAAQEWAAANEVVVVGVNLPEGDRVVVDVAGPAKPGSSVGLARELAGTLDERTTVEVMWTKREAVVATAGE